MNHATDARRAIKRTPAAAPIPILAAAPGLSVDELVVGAGLVEEAGVVEVVETVDEIEVVEGVAVYHLLVLAGWHGRMGRQGFHSTLTGVT
jgi:hypothetical protein